MLDYKKYCKNKDLYDLPKKQAKRTKARESLNQKLVSSEFTQSYPQVWGKLLKTG